MNYQELLQEIREQESSISRVKKEIKSIDEKIKDTIKSIEERQEEQRLKELIIEFESYKKSALEEFDKNNDEEIDLIDNDFDKLLIKNQKRVTEIDKNYIHKFVKVSNYIKTKKQNIQKIFEPVASTKNKNELDLRIRYLKEQIHLYEQTVFHSINMIVSLLDENLITFYEIYESFDKLGIFNSNWENEVASNLNDIEYKLDNIENKLDDLMGSIYEKDEKMVRELRQLNYFNQESYIELNQSVTKQLKAVESSINGGNLLTAVQTYQLYKINKNTNTIRG